MIKLYRPGGMTTAYGVDVDWIDVEDDQIEAYQADGWLKAEDMFSLKEPVKKKPGRKKKDA